MFNLHPASLLKCPICFVVCSRPTSQTTREPCGIISKNRPEAALLHEKGRRETFTGGVSTCGLVCCPAPGWRGWQGRRTRPAGRWTRRLLCFVIRRENLQRQATSLQHNPCNAYVLFMIPSNQGSYFGPPAIVDIHIKKCSQKKETLGSWSGLSWSLHWFHQHGLMTQLDRFVILTRASGPLRINIDYTAWKLVFANIQRNTVLLWWMSGCGNRRLHLKPPLSGVENPPDSSLSHQFLLAPTPPDELIIVAAILGGKV